MRRSPPPFVTFLAVAAVWLAASVVTRGAAVDVGRAVAGVQLEAVALAPSHAAVIRLSAPHNAPPREWSSGPFLPSRGVAHRPSAAGGRRAAVRSPMPDCERRTVTYDATAPPGEIRNTVA